MVSKKSPSDPVYVPNARPKSNPNLSCGAKRARQIRFIHLREAKTIFMMANGLLPLTLTLTLPLHNRTLALIGGSDYVYDAKWSPVHPAVFASVDGTGSLDLWHLNEDFEMPRHKVQVSDHAMNRLRWSKDGRHIVTGSTQGHLYLYDVAQEVGVPGDGEWTKFDERLAELRAMGGRRAAEAKGT